MYISNKFSLKKSNTYLMNHINIIILLFILLVYLAQKVSINEAFSVAKKEKMKDKDWLEELFDSREIITIPSRRKYVNDFCNSFQIKPTIFNATLKSDLSYNNIYRLKMGEIACAISQEKVLRKFVNSNHSSLLLFEDDNISFTNDVYATSKINLQHIKKYIKNCVESLPSDWDVLYLGRCWDNCSRNVKINKYLFKTHRTLCHHAIAFSKSGAEKILDAITHPLTKPIDHIVANLTINGVIDSYASVVPIFYQNRDELMSTIGNFDNLPVCM